MIRPAARILAMLVASVAVAAGHVQYRGLSWKTDVAALERRQELRGQVAERHAELRETVGVSLEEFQDLIVAGAVVIDARPRSEFVKRHLAIDSYPPVLNIEPHEVDLHLERLYQLQGQPIVIYCTSGDCELGEELYLALEPFGFTDMTIYFPGWEGILAAGWPTTAGPDTWTGYDDLYADPLPEDMPLDSDGAAGPDEDGE